MKHCKFLFSLFLALFLHGCTTVGFHRNSIRETHDFGKLSQIRVCVWKDENVSEERMRNLFEIWNEELSLYKLHANISNVRKWNRKGWTGGAIMEELYESRMPPECDRIFALAGFKFSDLVFEIGQIILALFFIPTYQILGAVDSPTGTRGYILAHTSTLGHLLVGGASSTMVHEGYHLLGCGHGFFLSDCYEEIEKLKKASDSEKAKQYNFLPALNPEGGFIYDRREINLLFLGN
ncbi:hypothetical protein CH373_08755 [Leptospira perolatii]|uniref:Uncharacterized protein n=2 Tax=Leptospira perolatii TaxID=2023191 RepID=A0A2M9ZNC0_9LEPT|nr:hypothetical protein [Leptospira perolatii]PJZ69591.1 hypothetical protein CH360_09900 [Leptospira perolatii]PJZ73578.1 hypothetical protein CH373_08755 [Leptospira perolatii]